MTPIRIVGLGGSPNTRSSTTAAVEIALAGARAAGAEVQRFDVDALDLPMYKWGMSSPVADELMTAVRQAHGMIWCSPLYHGTVSGVFKNVIDWFELLANDDPPYLSGKIIALMATAGGDQALQAINTMEYIVRALRGWTLPLTAPIARAGQAFQDGTPRDPELDERLRMIGRELVAAASAWQG
ncbi:NADPH-dependent FMN reductase [Haliangium sp.]|uniref:NADPH-dependent FMN reductase n=1 Tax=Haliangium sp. TaxID=2663208 RepID=UPI003D09BD7D